MCENTFVLIVYIEKREKLRDKIEMKKVLLVLLLSAILPFVANAQVDRELKKSVKVHFRQGATTLDENYMDNKATLSEFAREVKKHYSDSTAHFRQIRVVSSASPEGGKTINDRIAKQRAEAITRWISNEIAVDLDYAVESTGIDWALLNELILADSNVPYRDEVVELLNSTPVIVVENGKEIEKRYNALKAFEGGQPYQYIYKTLFPQLRYASARCEFWWEVMPELLLGTEPIRVGAEGGAAAARLGKTVADNVIPTASVADSWVQSIIPTAENVTLNVAPNLSAEPRTTTLVLECYGKHYEIPVEQEGAEPQTTLSKSSVEYPAASTPDTVAYTKNSNDDVLPVATCSADWIESIVVTEDGVSYVVAENTSEEPRTTTMLVESYGKTQELLITQAGAESACSPFYMGIKTNMLYDVAGLPNLGAEFYLGKKFSIAANYAHGWWSNDAKSFYWRYYGADASIRWWFGKPSRIKPLQGHHLGVNYTILTYDFQLGKTGIMAGMPAGNLVDRANHIVALEYGYSLPIAKRLNLDFTIAGGYHWGLFEEYKKIDGHNVWQATKRRQYFGPTKLEISLVWLIGCDNYNKDKGGKR